MDKNTAGTKRGKGRKIQVVDEDRVDDTSGEDSVDDMEDDMGGEEVVPHDNDSEAEFPVKHRKPTKNSADILCGRRTFGGLKIGMKAVVEMTPLQLPNEKNMDRNVSDELTEGNRMKKKRNVNVLKRGTKSYRQIDKIIEKTTKITKKTAEKAMKTKKQVQTKISDEVYVMSDDIDIETMSDDVVSETTPVEPDSDVLTAFLQATKGLMKSMDDSIEKCRADQDDGDCVSAFDLVS